MELIDKETFAELSFDEQCEYLTNTVMSLTEEQRQVMLDIVSVTLKNKNLE